ncbi:unnamed protein product [Cyprideis torosa]|uniref:Uncharacterized protein n=1 Tax=Cyprideis torosa TaxID=163714 RepID=A0A7R8VZY0_9CRUS|nr:unnamed protein product [Cyprideis torosa]CAG0879156.1 unnamed protein product [Cyprideis torosa]
MKLPPVLPLLDPTEQGPPPYNPQREEGRVPPERAAVAAPSGGLKLGIVRLGRAAGKTKYALLDEVDISLVQRYAFQARVEVDRNGCGARVTAVVFELSDVKRDHPVYLQDLIWELHKGGIASGFKVIHKNGIGVDNRLDNLMLVSKEEATSMNRGSDVQCSVRDSSRTNWTSNNFRTKDLGNDGASLEEGLYWIAIQQLPMDPVEEVRKVRSILLSLHRSLACEQRLLDGNGEFISSREAEEYAIYECRFPPCTRIEQEIREFSICGRCQEARYCGPLCQQRDWPFHKKYCRERKPHSSSDDKNGPER